jgi:hypothetical protein
MTKTTRKTILIFFAKPLALFLAVSPIKTAADSTGTAVTVYQVCGFGGAMAAAAGVAPICFFPAVATMTVPH